MKRRRAIAAAAILALLAAAWLTYRIWPDDGERALRAHTQITLCRYYQIGDKRGNQLYFAAIGKDSLLQELTWNAQKIRSRDSHADGFWANRSWIYPSCGGRIIAIMPDEHTPAAADIPPSILITNQLRAEKLKLAKLCHLLTELKYYLRVHGVQDEGYDIVAKYTTNALLRKDTLAKNIALLERMAKNPNITIRRADRYVTTYQTPDGKTAQTACRIVARGAHHKLLLRTNDGKTPDGVKAISIMPWTTDTPGALSAMTEKIKKTARGSLTHGVIRRNSTLYRGEIRNGKRNGKGIMRDAAGNLYNGTWNCDTLVSGTRTDSLGGRYTGFFDRNNRPKGYGVYQSDGIYYEGHWTAGRRDGFGMGITADNRLKAGEWKSDRFRGERITHTSDRIYGIDVSKHQHVKGRKYYAIDWRALRITSLGTISKKRVTGHVDYPVSFVYLKCTEGKRLFNPYYQKDYRAAKAAGFKVGSYHFFTTAPAALQARNFLCNASVASADFPPVLDVEPHHAQIKRMGGPAALFHAVRAWLHIVERATGRKPILYVNQPFVNRYLPQAPDLKLRYRIWIARYGEYKPDVRLVFWQLSPDGRVKGIHGPVDINVFNGYQSEFQKFCAGK